LKEPRTTKAKDFFSAYPFEISGRLSNCSSIVAPTCVVIFRICPSSITFELNGFRSLLEQTFHDVNPASGLK
jgi:hypothetical protein